jgi:hypothetical protein
MAIPLENKKQNLKGFSLVEDIFKEMTAPKKEVKPGTTVSMAPTPDLNEITVPDSLVESLLNFASHKREIKPRELDAVAKQVIEDQVQAKEAEAKEEEINEEVVAENKLSDLVTRLSDLLKEAKQVINEMTTAGMIGTNQKFVLGKKKKNGLTKSNKRN